nr:Wadjet anti-phage system protein JetA family protein [uncultured Schaedlerella sp.]
MNLISKIPKDFYKLFASKYMDYYQRFLIAIYEESGRSYSLLGLTERECRMIMNEQIAAETLDWSEEQFDEEGELLTRSNMASICLKHLEDWGWLRRDYDEVLDSYVVSFPEYSQLFVELFQRLYSEEDTRERESVLAVYSYLYTYSSDCEKNNDILKSALQASRSLLQMLSNMQEGMRGYFDELSRQRSFLGIQEVLVKEMNNNESRKYAILTTTDSFYRYKEAVKELIDRNLSENEARKQELEGRQRELADEAMDIILLIEREFDAIERRYNKLIEQKTLFASRAAARIRYILMEGALEEDPTAVLVKLLNQSRRSTEILEKLSGRMRLTEPFRMVTGQSLAHRRNMEKTAFAPQAVVRDAERQEEGLDEFVLKPLYTRQEIAEFRRKNERNGAFTVTEDTVRSTEDLEKLFFVWQDAVEIADDAKKIEIGEELENREGCRFSALTIQE